MSLHKCFVRYEDDFGSYWTVDDAEFVRRRHLSRGRPRKYEPQNSTNGNGSDENGTEIELKNEFSQNSSQVLIKKVYIYIFKNVFNLIFLYGFI